MCTMNRAYERFGRWLERHGPEDASRGFRAVCREVRVCPPDLDEVLIRETGMSGDEILDIYFGIGVKKC